MEQLFGDLLTEDIGVLKQKLWIIREFSYGLQGQVLRLS